MLFKTKSRSLVELNSHLLIALLRLSLKRSLSVIYVTQAERAPA